MTKGIQSSVQRGRLAIAWYYEGLSNEKSNLLHASCVHSWIRGTLKKSKETNVPSPTTPCPAGCKGSPQASRQRSNQSPKSSSRSSSCGRAQASRCSLTRLHSVKRKLAGTSFGPSSAQLGHFHFKYLLDLTIPLSPMTPAGHSLPPCQDVHGWFQDGAPMLQGRSSGF